MTKRITTPNMLEIAYLLDRHHRITSVSTQAGWPYGIDELAVTIEGENIDLDRMSFCRHSGFSTPHLPELTKAFAAVQAVIDRQLEDAALSGGRS